VRDTARLHLLAMMAPGVSGQRSIASSGFFWMKDIARMLKAELGDAARNVPSVSIPDFIVRIFALFDPLLRSRLLNWESAGWFHRTRQDECSAGPRGRCATPLSKPQQAFRRRASSSTRFKRPSFKTGSSRQRSRPKAASVFLFSSVRRSPGISSNRRRPHSGGWYVGRRRRR